MNHKLLRRLALLTAATTASWSCGTQNLGGRPMVPISPSVSAAPKRTFVAKCEDKNGNGWGIKSGDGKTFVLQITNHMQTVVQTYPGNVDSDCTITYLAKGQIKFKIQGKIILWTPDNKSPEKDFRP